MKIINEIKISLFNPLAYYKLKQEPMLNIFVYQFVISILGFIFINIKKIITVLTSGGAIKFADAYKGITPWNIILTLLYMWLGIIMAAFILSSLVYLFYNLKKEKALSFKDVYNYISHALIIAAILQPFIGVFVILFVIMMYHTAAKGGKPKVGMEALK